MEIQLLAFVDSDSQNFAEFAVVQLPPIAGGARDEKALYVRRQMPEVCLDSQAIDRTIGRIMRQRRTPQRGDSAREKRFAEPRTPGVNWLVAHVWQSLIQMNLDRRRAGAVDGRGFGCGFVAPLLGRLRINQHLGRRGSAVNLGRGIADRRLDGALEERV